MSHAGGPGRRTFLTWLLGGLAASARALAGQSESRATAPGATQRPLASEGSSSAPQRKPLFEGAPAPDDPLELLYSRRLAFDGGQPLITVRVVEGREEVALVPTAPLTVHVRNAAGEPRL